MSVLKNGEMVEHYRRRFRKSGREAGPRAVGMEAKFCVTDGLGKAVSAEATDRLFRSMARSGWNLETDGGIGMATAVSRDSLSYPARISTGTGHCKIEFSVPYAASVHGLGENFNSMASDFKSACLGEEIRLLCLGVHPVTRPDPCLVQRKPRHLFWDTVFTSGLVHLFALSSDCQVHVDVNEMEAVKALRVLQGYAGAQIALTANATLWRGGLDEGHVDLREAFWEWWLPGDDRVGVPAAPSYSLESYVDRIAEMRPVFVERESGPLGIYDYPTFESYYDPRGKSAAVTPDGARIEVTPKPEDIDLHDTFNWNTARLSHYGTVENRANCQQPPERMMALPALTVGLVENMEEASCRLEGSSWRELGSFYGEAVGKGPLAKAGGIEAQRLCREMLELSREGLRRRGFGEEYYLDPLEDAAEKGQCPAFETREIFENGGIKAVVERYSLWDVDGLLRTAEITAGADSNDGRP